MFRLFGLKALAILVLCSMAVHESHAMTVRECVTALASQESADLFENFKGNSRRAYDQRISMVDEDAVRNYAAQVERGAIGGFLTRQPSAPELAAAAYSKGLITLENFVSQMLRTSAQVQFGAIDKNPTFLSIESQQSKDLLKDYLGPFTAGQKVAYLSALSEIPKSERHISIYRLKYERDENGTLVLLDPRAEKWKDGLEVYDVTDFAFSRMGENIFEVVVPSFSMLQLYLKIAHPQSFAVLQPIMGSSKEATLVARWFNGQRDFWVHNPFKPLPFYFYGEGDPFWVGPYFIMYHDFAHAYGNSKLSKNHRALIAHILELAKGAEFSARLGLDLHKMTEYLVDIDPNGPETSYLIQILRQAYYSNFDKSSEILTFIFKDYFRNKAFWRSLGFDLDVELKTKPGHDPTTEETVFATVRGGK